MSQDNEDDSAVQPPQPQPKYARYRSVRHAAAVAAKEVTMEPAPAEEKTAIPSRSMSRYRRPRAVSKPEQPAIPPATSIPAVPALPPAQSSAAPIRRVTDPASTSNYNKPRNISDGGWVADTDEQRHEAQRARDYEQRLQAQIIEEKLAEQKKKDLERLEATLDAAAASSPVKEKFSFFTRKRAHTKAAPPPVAVAPASTPGPSSASLSRTGSNDTSSKSTEARRPRAGTAAVPGSDAPISAVNAGERVGLRAVEIYPELTCP